MKKPEQKAGHNRQRAQQKRYSKQFMDYWMVDPDKQIDMSDTTVKDIASDAFKAGRRSMRGEQDGKQ